MPTVKIDNIEYDFDTLPQAAKAQLQSLQFVDSELQRLQNQASVLQTARAAYSKALNESIAAVVPPLLAGGGDTLKLS